MAASRLLSRLFHQTPPPHGEPRQREPASGSTSPTTPFSNTSVNSAAYWKRAVLESAGVKDSTCEINGPTNNPNCFPALSPGYHSLYSTIRGSESSSSIKVHRQSQSMFFSRLPPEVRVLVYHCVFGARRIHFDFDFQANRGRWAWWHRVCDDAQNCAKKEFVCPENAGAEFSMISLGSTAWVKPGFQYKVDAVGWLRVCKKGYEEGLPILYVSNTFVLTQSIDQLFRLSRAMPSDHLALMTSLHIEIDAYRAYKGSPEMEPEFEAYYRRIFEILLRSLPNVRDLRFSIAGLPNRQGSAMEWSEQSEWLWIGPWEELAQSRDWKRLEIAVPITWHQDFEAVVERRSQLEESKKYRLVEGAGLHPKGW